MRVTKANKQRKREMIRTTVSYPRFSGGHDLALMVSDLISGFPYNGNFSAWVRDQIVSNHQRAFSAKPILPQAAK